MNGKTFLSLTKLQTVWLKGNACIDEDFGNKTAIATLGQVVDEKCGFDESM